jgi:hypothetical protein
MQHILRICLPTLLAFSLSASGAQNLVANGDFEAGTGTGINRNFDVTPSWYNRADAQNTNARKGDKNLEGSSFNAVLSDRAGYIVLHSPKTKYTTKAGDRFDVSFNWMGNHLSWNNRDFVRVVLFATQDNQVQGRVVWEHLFDGAPSAGMLGTWEAVGGRTDVVATEAVGKRLFINFYGMDSFGEDFGKPGYARLDNLSVTVVQQPLQ